MPPGVELDGGDAGGGNPLGIHIGINIGFHDADAILILESLNGTGQRCGLAGTRRRHQVQKKDALFVKLLAK